MSQFCHTCGATSFSLVDGFYYCDICSAQSQRGCEIDAEVEDTSGVSRGLKSKSHRKSELLDSQQKSIKPLLIDPALINNERPLYEEDFPKYLAHTGLRITTFTKLVAKLSYILVRNIGCSERVIDNSFRLLQNYFRFFGVAFTAAEVTSDSFEDSFRLIFEKTKSEIRSTKKTDLSRRRSRSRLNKNQLTDGSQPSNWNEMVSQPMELDPDESEAHVISELTEPEIIETCLSKQAVEIAGQVYLHVDMVLAIIYLSCLISGCEWILISDIHRWYREGRLPISASELESLGTSTKFKESAPYWHSRNSEYRAICQGTIRMNYPLYEALRPLAFYIDYTKLPKSISSLDLTSLLHRFVWNLNLPKAFLDRLNVLLAILPKPNIDMGKISSRFHYDINFLDKFITKKRKYDYGIDFPNQRCIYMCSETKAAALILFTLKMIFGIDDKGSDLQVLKSTSNVFIFSNWIHQYHLRLLSWKGVSPKLLLSKEFDILPETSFSSKENVSRITDFKGCIPYRTSQISSEKLFNGLFNVDKGEQKIVEEWSKESLYVPLRFQATKNREMFRDELLLIKLGEGLKSDLDTHNVELLFESYENASMEYLIEKLDQASNEWNILFPCSTAYKRYPLPSKFSALMNWVNPLSASSPVLDLAELDSIYAYAEKHFSDDFRRLLSFLATTISESPSVLYYAFLMIETMILDKEWMNDLEDLLRNCDGYEYSSVKRGRYKGDEKRILRLHKCENEPRYEFEYLTEKKHQLTSLKGRSDFCETENVADRDCPLSTGEFAKNQSTTKETCQRIQKLLPKFDSKLGIALTCWRFW